MLVLSVSATGTVPANALAAAPPVCLSVRLSVHPAVRSPDELKRPGEEAGFVNQRQASSGLSPTEK